MNRIFTRGLSPNELPVSHIGITRYCVGPIEAAQQQSVWKKILDGPTLPLEHIAKYSTAARNLLTLSETREALPPENPELQVVLSAFAKSLDAQQTIAPLTAQITELEKVMSEAHEQLAKAGFEPATLADIAQIQASQN